MKISESVLLALATGLPATIASLATLIGTIKNSKKLQVTNDKITEIHEKTNGIQEALIVSTAKAAHAEGMADQRAQDRKQDKP